MATSTFELGESIPDTQHAVSVSLPTWAANVGYEEGESWVVSKMNTGYPRFFIHKSIARLTDAIVALYAKPNQTAMLFPKHAPAQRCLDFVRGISPEPLSVDALHIVDLVLDVSKPVAPSLARLAPAISAVVMDTHIWPLAKQYWQHSGDGVSSRRAEFSYDLLTAGLFKLASPKSAPSSPTAPVSAAPPAAPSSPAPISCRGPRRYQKRTDSSAPKSPSPPADEVDQAVESFHFLEERFGRNLDLSLVSRARSAIRRRIAGAVACESTSVEPPAAAEPAPVHNNTRGIKNLHENDVYLYPCGMNAIFNVHRALLKARGPLRSVNLGFPYVDTLKILQKFGPGCQFYGHASDADLDDFEKRLVGGEKFLALFCEFPGNPLLTCPDLVRIRSLADKYSFAVVVDETIGTFANMDVLKFADVVVSSLTKIFSGESNVMGGSAILNPHSPLYASIKATMDAQYEDTYWPEDIIFMERNSRDFQSRIDRANANSLALCDVLRNHPLVKTVYYPKYNESRTNYEVCRLPNGGYGGLLSVVFKEDKQAIKFYDNLATAKGPSLGTNFTLTSPYVLLAHYQELDWAASYGVEPNLVRISVGLEETEELVRVFKSALEAAAQ
ncbi:hypothetical protein TD95_002520 [Thielaviopsis punctulata]|uniref:cystathionine gamma-synthase n=1 Tax=Thielaviopsis punctulata TaxID=72032 RepID=A0A0F4ZGF3_9PEZI|nr:hypothetical protein TD95_002520 [Thielaviopsis punctulata]